MLTIGQVAKQVGLRTSALRYYEKEGLLAPVARSESGYRLYSAESVQRLRLIQQAQRLGFALADIRSVLDSAETGNLSNAIVIEAAQERYLALEAQITRRLVQQHELGHFLTDLSNQSTTPLPAGQTPFDDLTARICAGPHLHATPHSMFTWLLEQTECNLTGADSTTILNRLRGRHVHIWQDEDTYHILVVGKDTAIGDALNGLAALESNCSVHDATTVEPTRSEQGYLLTVSGPNAFIYARLFLALEQDESVF
ncbi:MAG: MerR family transcriptional regulator [Anaerolineae bacterium]|nr:MerR family transcriptional regulator [Anaerolineae bacterium]